MWGFAIAIRNETNRATAQTRQAKVLQLGISKWLAEWKKCSRLQRTSSRHDRQRCVLRRALNDGPENVRPGKTNLCDGRNRSMTHISPAVLRLELNYLPPSQNVLKRMHWTKQYKEKQKAFDALQSALHFIGFDYSIGTTTLEAQGFA